MSETSSESPANIVDEMTFPTIWFEKKKRKNIPKNLTMTSSTSPDLESSAYLLPDCAI